MKNKSFYVAITFCISTAAITTRVGAAENLEHVDSPSFYDSLKNGKSSANARVFYFNRNFDAPNINNTTALTAGGIFKYESAGFKHIKTGFAYYGSHSLFNIFDREEGTGTSLIQSDGNDIAFLGEAYIDYDDGINQLKVGRQRLATPLINDHDLRLLPSSYEAAVFRNRSLPKTLLEVGYVTRYSGFSSKLSNFDDQDEKWGADGLAYLYAETTLSDISVKAQYIDALDNSGIFSDYSYADARFPLALGQKSFISVQYGGTGYQSGTSGHMYGVKAGTSIGSWDLAVLYNAITDNSFLAVESGPMYSDWQQGYGNYEPSDAYGVQVSYHPSPGWSLKTGFVDVQADEDDGYLRDIFTETYIDTSYKLNDYSNVRLRYSIKNQASNSTREDRNDFRIIYYISF